MNKVAERSVNKAVDSIQQRLTSYACELNYDDLSLDAIHAAKVRIIDTLGALMGGFFGEPCRIARNLAAQMPQPNGVTVIGTRMKTTPDMAAFVNATTARYPELNDIYQWPAGAKGHPSDTLMAVFAAAEHARVSGREFITGVVLAYEVYQRICDVFHNLAAFDNANFACIGAAVATGKLWGLSAEQLSHCISMAVVPNIVLRQIKQGEKSMFKAVGPGQAGRAAVFAALLARAGMEGPHLPFEGKAGWCDHVALERFSLNAMGGKGTPFKIMDSHIKLRPSCGSAISSILAAEKVSPFKNIKDVKQVIVEVYKRARDSIGSGELPWNPKSREDADHSIPYLVATTLVDGTVTLRSFDDAHLQDPALRAFMQKIEVLANEEFTNAFERLPQQYRARVTVVTHSGERSVGESGGDQGDVAAPKSDALITDKFRGLTEDVLGVRQVKAILDRLWHLEDVEDVAAIPPAFVLD